jgi:hypothetical protein
MPVQTGVRFIPRRDKPDPVRADYAAADAIAAFLLEQEQKAARGAKRAKRKGRKKVPA